MCKWAACVLLFGFLLSAHAEVTIKELSGTDNAEIGTSTALNCEYDVKNETGVEVKWFYNQNMQMVSWVPDKTKPQPIGIFKTMLTVTNSTLKNGVVHSTIRFKEVTFNLTGDYTCKVSADAGEDFKTQTMIVYQPPSAVEFWNKENEKPEEPRQELICSASELYPLPNVTVVGSYISGSNESVPIEEEKEIVIGLDENSYNVTKIYKFDPSILQGSVEFTCNVFIPDTNYNEEMALTYEKESNDSTAEYPDIYDFTSTVPINSTMIYSTTEAKPSSSISLIPWKWLILMAIAVLGSKR